MKKNKFTSYIFSCLGVAACFSLYSCGDKTKNEEERLFQEYCKAYHENEGKDLSDQDKDFIKKFVKEQLKNSKKDVDLNAFKEYINKNSISTTFSNSTTSSKSTNNSSTTSSSKTINNSSSNSTNSSTSQKAVNTNSVDNSSNSNSSNGSSATVVNDNKNDDKVVKDIFQDNQKHYVVKLGNNVFDLNVFHDLYSWVYKKAGDSKNDLRDPNSLTIANIKTIVLGKIMPDSVTNQNEKTFGLNANIIKQCSEEGKVVEYTFIASSETGIKNNNNKDGRSDKECPLYNGLVKFLVGKSDLGFNEACFESGQLKSDASLDKNNNNTNLQALIKALTEKNATVN